jgi:hypothetical protein
MMSVTSPLPHAEREPSVDIVIVNWNAGRYLLRCLESIEQIDDSDADVTTVVVVDNASTDDSLARLDTLALPLKVLRNSENRGFAAACNQGAAGSHADYVLFLNPDTQLSEQSLATAVRFMQSEKATRVGICGGHMTEEDDSPGNSCSRFPSLRCAFAKMIGLNLLLPRWFPSQELSPAETVLSRPVDQVIGAFFLVRRSLLSRLGGFDERYFLYYEDVDFSFRASQLGYSSYFLANVHVYHKGNVSSDQVRAKRLFYSLRSRDAYAARYWPRWKARLLVALNLAVELPARCLKAGLSGNWRELRHTVEGYRCYTAQLLTARRHGDDDGTR